MQWMQQKIKVKKYILKLIKYEFKIKHIQNFGYALFL